MYSQEIQPGFWKLHGPQGRAWKTHAEGAKLSGLGKAAFVCLWLLVFAIPWEDAITIGSFGTSARLIGFVAVAFGLLAIFERGKVRQPAPAHLLMLLFIAIAGMSYSWSLYPEGTLAQTFTYLQLFIMVWLIWEIAARPQEQMRLMQAYVLGTIVSGVDTVYLYLSHQESAYQRYSGAGLNANDLGLIVALSIPISYYLLIQSSKPIVWVYRLQLALAGTTILLTASRGATLAGVVAFAIVPLTHTSLTTRQRILILVTASLLIYGALAFVPATSWERLSTMPDEFSQGTLTGRTIIWKTGWDLFRANPYLGIGANTFRLIASRLLAEPIPTDQVGLQSMPAAHNTFLSVLVEQGIVGFAVFCGILGVLVLSLGAMPIFQRKFWIVCLAVWVVGVAGLTWEMRKATWFLFGLLAAQSGCIRKGLVRAGRVFDSFRRISYESFAVEGLDSSARACEQES
jgi:O-antigen ligase